MKTNAERMSCVILKAAEMKRRKEKRKLNFCKTATAFLSVFLLYCINAFSIPYKSAAVEQHCGTILLIDGIGGYVLTAVLTFIAATIITVICIKIQNRRTGK